MDWPWIYIRGQCHFMGLKHERKRSTNIKIRNPKQIQMTKGKKLAHSVSAYFLIQVRPKRAYKGDFPLFTNSMI